MVGAVFSSHQDIWTAVITPEPQSSPPLSSSGTVSNGRTGGGFTLYQVALFWSRVGGQRSEVKFSCRECTGQRSGLLQVLILSGQVQDCCSPSSPTLRMTAGSSLSAGTYQRAGGI
ncbi:hypothetical protein ANANG_G00111040 [Anguilla anguilla]|uniref:Uncharacterized protein n=1 Tax=Anguilla anguilla TaxID=7936 RepID=A0A9D3S453_ANGAN|nr:hypothetical protein ANANG_G00111040 [Anguilla anguilla]